MSYTQKRAHGDIEHLRKLIGDDCPIEDVLPMCAGVLAAVPVQAAAIRQLRDVLANLLAEFGQDVDDDRVLDTWSAQLTRAEIANLHLILGELSSKVSTMLGLGGDQT